MQGKGLLTRKELNENKHDTKRIDYGWLFCHRYDVLGKAYSRFLKKGGKTQEEYKAFLRKNKSWLEKLKEKLGDEVDNTAEGWELLSVHDIKK